MTAIFPLASCAHFSLLVILLRHFCGLLLYFDLQGSILSSYLFPQTSLGPARSSPSQFLQASYISNPSATCPTASWTSPGILQAGAPKAWRGKAPASIAKLSSPSLFLLSSEDRGLSYGWCPWAGAKGSEARGWA